MFSFNKFLNESEKEKETFVLLQCIYEGDGWLLDIFIACGELEALKAIIPTDGQLFLPGQEVPDDGNYGDKRKRYKIVKVPFLTK